MSYEKAIILTKFSFFYNDVFIVLPPSQLDLDIQLFLEAFLYVEAFIVLVYNKTNYHPAFFSL